MELSDLNAEQYAAATYNGRHLLVTGGAGTGKTTTLTARAKFLTDTGVPPAKIVILSPTGRRGMTFHTWCREIISEFKEDFGMDGYSFLNEEDRKSCRDIIDSQFGFLKLGRLAGEVLSYSTNAMCGIEEAIYKVILSHTGREQQARDESVRDKEKYLRFIDAFIEYKRSHKYLDVDDLIGIVSTAMRENAVLRKKIAARYEHILVDSIEDATPLQYSLLSLFKDDSSLFCAGDDAQSIYGFCGADCGNMSLFAQKFSGAAVLPLNLTYRPPVVPEIISADHHSDLVRHLVADIRENVGTCGYRYCDNMILARASYQLRYVEGALRKEGIPYVRRGGGSHGKRRHIRLILSPLRVAANHKDEFAWIDYLNTSEWEVFDGGVKAHINPKWTKPELSAAVTASASFEEALEVLYGYSVPQYMVEPLIAVRAVLNSPKEALVAARKYLEPILRVNCVDAPRNQMDSDFEILADIASRCSSVAQFVADYLLDPRLCGGNKEEGDCVIVSTIHSAKGLECRHCYLWDIDTADKGQETQRLLHVATTRAKDKLTIYR